MCQIDLNITYTDQEGTGVLANEAEYKQVNSNVWIPFILDINNPKTPDLQTEGQYQLRIRLYNGYGWSDWFMSLFNIGCGAFSDGFSDGFDT